MADASERPFSRARPIGGRWNALGAALCFAFLALQIPGLDHGTTINNLPHIVAARVPPGAIDPKRLERRNLVAEKSGIAETQGKWAMRFKIYSVMPDDVVSIMALSRIRPAELRFDPGFYQYGGAYLYPLGGWYFLLQKAGGWVRPGGLEELVGDPDRMDAIYIAGRLFVLLGFALSAWLMWLVLVRLAEPRIAGLLLALYLAMPVTIQFSQLMKPHWYALLWVNLALLGLVGVFQRRGTPTRNTLTMGLGAGLAVGSAATFAPFALGLWIALAVAVGKGFARLTGLVLVPMVAIVAFAVTNPYVFLNWAAYQAERQTAIRDWFGFDADPSKALPFLWNSFLPGVGIAAGVLIVVVALIRLIRPQGAGQRAIAAAVLASILLAAALTAALHDWNTNLRYVPYLIPMALLLLALTDFPYRVAVLSTVLAFTVLQAIPMWLAYQDENNPRHSTRLLAAAWVDRHVKPGSRLRLSSATPGPYEVPPFHLSRYRYGMPDDFGIWVHMGLPTQPPAGYKLLVRFRARLASDHFALVYNFINPTISIYRNTRTGGTAE